MSPDDVVLFRVAEPDDPSTVCLVAAPQDGSHVELVCIVRGDAVGARLSPVQARNLSHALRSFLEAFERVDATAAGVLALEGGTPH